MEEFNEILTKVEELLTSVNKPELTVMWSGDFNFILQIDKKKEQTINNASADERE